MSNEQVDDVPQVGMYGDAPPDEAAAPPPQEAAATAIAEVSAAPETLHLAARAGSVDTVKMLLRNGADIDEKDKEGKTALQHAQEAGQKDIEKHLQEVMDANRKSSDPEESYDQGFEDEEPVATNANSAPSPEAASTPSVQLDAPTPADEVQEAIGTNSPEKANRSRDSSPAKSPTGTSKVGDDLKARTMFAMSTTDGVLKRTTFIHKISGYRSAPSITIASKSGSMFMRSAQGPSPGSYNLPDDEKSKFKTSGKFSFGGGSRFGLAGSPTKLQPGPGAYNPKDPALSVDTKVGFGTSVRNKGGASSQANPGPGAYENRSTVGGGLMFTATGRHPQSYMRSRSLPGPGAYSPLPGAYQTSPKCGFGTSTRGALEGGARGQPGPGTYDMQNWKCVGKDSLKFSATSRRKMTDLNSYVTPGPGTYNAHATSFGSPGAYSCRHVDEGYKLRNDVANAEPASTMRATH